MNIDIMNNSIISMLLPKILIGGNYRLVSPFIQSVIKTILKSKKGSKDTCMSFMLNKNNTVPTGVKRLEAILVLENQNRKKIFKLPFAITKNTKLQWLQYRINHKILATNKILNKIRIVQNQYCTFCKTELESIEHILWDCYYVQQFIEQTEMWFLQIGISIPFKQDIFLFGNLSRMYKRRTKYTRVKLINRK